MSAPEERRCRAAVAQSRSTTAGRARSRLARLVLVWAVAAPAPAAATEIATIVRGAGASAEKPAALVGYHVRTLLADDGRYEVVDNAARLEADAAEAERAYRDARDLVREAMAAYETLDLDPALESLKAAVQGYEGNIAHLTDVKPLAEALMLLGAVHILSGQERLGGERLAQAVALVPTIEPDPRIFNPSMRQMFQRAAEEVTRRPRGTLSVTSSPGAAELYVDGVFRGVTPAMVEQLPPGRHYLRLVRDGHRAYGAVVAVPPGRELVANGVLRAVTQLDDYDRAVTAAMTALGREGDAEVPEAAIARLDALLGADHVLLAEVRLDAERVRVRAAQYDVKARRRLKVATHVFPHDVHGELMERELGSLLRTQFGETTLARASVEVAGLPGLASGAVCMGMSCDRLRRIALVGGAGGGAVLAGAGALLYALAKHDEDRFEQAVQGSSEASAIRSAGKTKALVGDIVLPVGLLAAAAGVGTFFLYQPVAASGAAAAPPATASLGVVPLAGGGAVVADVRF